MITVPGLFEKKRRGEKIVMLTAYDFPLARLVEEAGVDMILVGDSGGMVKLGYPNTLPVTMDEMVMMVRAVRRGAPNTFVVADLPFMSYQTGERDAVVNAGRFVKDAGADAVKLEGGMRMANVVRAITDAGIAAQGHIGVTPQNVTQLGGYRVQGKTLDAARRLVEDALALEQAGAFSLILEALPVRLATYITDRLQIPTIGTGAGGGCSGQNLITADAIGYFKDDFLPRYVKRYANVNAVIREALAKYRSEVGSGDFPADEHSYSLADDSYLDVLFAEMK